MAIEIKTQTLLPVRRDKQIPVTIGLSSGGYSSIMSSSTGSVDLSGYLTESSIGTNFYWVSGYLDVSNFVPQSYIDGSISLLKTYFDGSVAEYNTAYNDRITSAGFNTGTGVITLTQGDSGTITVDIDGRFEPLYPTVEVKTSTWLPSESDCGKIIECNGNINVQLSSGFDAGFNIVVVNVSTGTVTFVPGSGVTMFTKDGSTKLKSAYVGATAYARSSSQWVVMGDLTN